MAIVHDGHGTYAFSQDGKKVGMTEALSYAFWNALGVPIRETEEEALGPDDDFPTSLDLHPSAVSSRQEAEGAIRRALAACSEADGGSLEVVVDGVQFEFFADGESAGYRIQVPYVLMLDTDGEDALHEEMTTVNSRLVAAAANPYDCVKNAELAVL